MKKTDYYICPGCGDDVRVGSEGCPKCNNLDPWEIEENEIYDGLDLPEEDEDLSYRAVNIHPIWVFTAVLLLIAFLVLILR